MESRDLFSVHRSPKRLNESLQKVFGKKINLENFSLEQLEDARNKLRTQISQVRSSSNFNETVENDAYHQAKFMLDAIVAEIADREKFVADSEIEETIDDSNEDSLESTQGDDMRRVTEGEVQQASAIVTAKTMVDRVGRWIEELSGMENETLLQLGDSIRDEMGQEQARAFIEQVAPAIQSALEALKSTRETLSSGVNTLATGEQPADMLGAEPGAEGDMTEPSPEAGAEMAPEEPGDEFAAAEPAAGPSEAGRAQRESVNFQNRLLKVLAG
jgi:hypothetical protein